MPSKKQFKWNVIMRVGDLVRYKYDPASTKTYLVATVDPKPLGTTDRRYATLFGWNQLNAAGLVQRFALDQLEVVAHASR
jgi:hypothetical protein